MLLLQKISPTYNHLLTIGAEDSIMSEVGSNKLKNISKQNFLWGLCNIFIVLPLLVSGLAFVSRHDEGDRSIELSEYFTGFLMEPVIFILFCLVVANTIVDFFVFKNNGKSILKKLLMIFNLFYIFFVILRVIFLSDGVEDFVVLGVLILILFYKIFRYYEYYKLSKDI